MPIFEYRCSDCEREFEAFVTAERTAACPACHGGNLVKLLSSPGMVGGSDTTRGRESMPMTGGCGAGGAHCACRAAAAEH
jgi:putative FmdB family regulatory protein